MNKILIYKFNIESNKRNSENKAKEKLFNIVGINSSSVIKKGSKPYLINKPFYFNLSHSNDYIGIAISDSEVGFDIEYIKDIKNKERLIKKIYSKNDLSNYSNNLIDILKVFTIKESYLKYLGIGITINLNEIIIENNYVYYKDYMKIKYKTYMNDNIIYTVCSNNEFVVEVNNEIL